MHAQMKLGKLAPRHDPRTLQLARYLTPALPKPPASVAWSSKVRSWPMYLNDSLGDCTCAAAGHMVQAWTADGQSKEIDITDAQVLKAYEAVGGYRPGNPSTDNGAVELDVLKYWKSHGIGGHKIGAYGSVDPLKIDLVRTGIFLFGGLYIGVALPISAQNQTTWDVPAGGTHGDGATGSWGGHAIPVLDYDGKTFTCITWGAVKRMTVRFFEAYCDEAHPAISNDFLKSSKAPNGFDLAALNADLAAI